MDLRMTGRAETHQVIFAVVTTFSQGLYVVNLLGFDVPTGGKTALAQGMSIHITVADALPCSAVASLSCPVAVVPFISFILFALVLRTVPALSQVRAARV